MARPAKKGIDYFPHDCTASHDERLEIFEIKYPNGIGYAWYFKTLERIYSHGGELDVSTTETCQILCRNLPVSPSEIVEYAVSIGLFDKDAYENRRVLTSDGIKNRIKPIIYKRKKMAFSYQNKVSEAEILPETYQKPTISEAEMSSKEKKRKEKKSKKKERKEEESKKNNKTNIMPHDGGESEWRKSFDKYFELGSNAIVEVLKDRGWFHKQEQYNPGVDIELSVKKSFDNFWGTQAGWRHKKKSKTVEIDWYTTFANAIAMNKVQKPRENQYGPKQLTNETFRRQMGMKLS